MTYLLSYICIFLERELPLAVLWCGGEFVFGSGHSVTCHHQSSAGGQKITASNKHLITTNADAAGGTEP